MKILQYFRALFARPAAGYTAVFLAVFAVCGTVQTASTGFPDPDSFYHLKISELMMQRGVIRDFSWLPFTTLAEAYADHHFLYHALLIPFIAAFGGFVGVKVATATFAACAAVAFYALLRALGVRWPMVFTLLLATSQAYLYRMNLAKTSSLSVAVLLLALLAIVRNKPRWLFALSFGYVWLYGGWPIMLVIVATFLAARAATDAAFDTHPVHSWAAPWFWSRLIRRTRGATSDFVGTAEVRLAVAAAAGVSLGLVMNPFFPNNLRFYWEQIVQIAVLGYKDKIGVGIEWYPYPAGHLLLGNSVIMLMAILALALLCAMVFWDDVVRGRDARLTRGEAGAMIATSALAILFLLLTMRSRRHVEYFAPFTMVALAQVWSLLLARLNGRALWNRLRDLVPRFPSLPAVLAGYGVALCVLLGVRDVLLVRESQSHAASPEKYAETGAWLRANVPAGEVVVHSDWDDFPMLFLHDDTHRYIAGLDATFLYRRDPARYQAWVDMTFGRTAAMAETAIGLFGSSTIVIENDHERMRERADADPALVKAHQDEYAAVYVISR